MDGQTKKWGVTNHISNAPPTAADLKLNDQLVEFLKQQENFESPEGIERRKKVLAHIEVVAKEFIRRVAKAKKLPQSTIDNLGGAVYTFGSYSLGVFGPSSDIDTLILAPKQISMDDYFAHFPQTFRDMSNAADIEEMVVVPDAFVPIITLEYRGVNLDLIFASLPSQSTIAKDFDLSDVKQLRGMDSISMRALNGTRVTKELLANVPQHKSFRYALRAIKLWAKQRGIYGAVFGYPGGIAWAIMVARISQLFPYACGATLVAKFFHIMRGWGWPRPCMLKEIDKENLLNLPVWNPATSHHDRGHLMPIITPAYPEMCATHSVMKSTFNVMMAEFDHAKTIVGAIQHDGKPWAELFKRHTFFTKDHKYYLSVVATSLNKDAHSTFSGWVKAKFRTLAKGVEEGAVGIEGARTYMDGFDRVHRCTDDADVERVRQGSMDFHIKSETVESVVAASSNGDGATIIYTTTFYIGLIFSDEGAKSLDISYPVDVFKHTVEDGAVVDNNLMFVRVVHTRDHQLPEDVFKSGETRPTKPQKKKKSNGSHANKKRPHQETGMQDGDKSTKKRASAATNGVPVPTPA